jgi:peptide/nickel transport system substrate-binding protein
VPKSHLRPLSASRNALSPIRRIHRAGPIAVLVAVAACSSSSGSSSSSSGQTGGHLSTLTLAVPSVTTTLDQSDFVGLSYLYGQPMFEGTLLRYKPLAADATSLDSPTDMAADLATSYQVTPQGIVLTLRQAKAPSGDVLSPADVRWTFQREAALDPVGQFYMSIAGIDPKDPVTILGAHSVRINGKLTPLALVPLVEPEFDIIDSTLAKAHAASSDPWAKTWLTSHSATYGAYQVQSLQSASRLTLTANPNYWAGTPPFNQVVLIANTGQSASELLQSGTVNGVLEVPLANFAQLRKASAVKTLGAPTLGQDVLELNERYGPFANTDVRRAMSMAIDRAALVSGPYFGAGKPSVSVVSQAIPGTTGTSTYYNYNLSAAKALLAQTPYKNGFSFTLDYQQAEVSSVDVSSLVVNLVSELAQLGIKVQASAVSSDAQFRAGEETHKYQAWLLGEGPVVADAAYLFGLYHVTGAESNFTGENNPQIDSLVTKAQALPIGAQRSALMNQAIALWNQNMYDLPLVQVESTSAFSSHVCGLAPSPYQLVLPYDLAQC